MVDEHNHLDRIRYFVGAACHRHHRCPEKVGETMRRRTRTRYFDMPNKRQTLKILVFVDSKADKATEADFTSAYNTTMKEVSRCEYNHLSKLYIGGE